MCFNRGKELLFPAFISQLPSLLLPLSSPPPEMHSLKAAVSRHSFFLLIALPTASVCCKVISPSAHGMGKPPHATEGGLWGSIPRQASWGRMTSRDGVPWQHPCLFFALRRCSVPAGGQLYPSLVKAPASKPLQLSFPSKTAACCVPFASRGAGFPTLLRVRWVPHPSLGREQGSW